MFLETEGLGCRVCTPSAWLYIVRSIYKVVVQIKLLKTRHCSIVLPIHHTVRHRFSQSSKYISIPLWFWFLFPWLQVRWGIFIYLLVICIFLFSDSSGLRLILFNFSYFLRTEYSLCHITRFHRCLGLALYCLISSTPIYSCTNTSLSSLTSLK